MSDFDDANKLRFVEAVAGMLEVQLTVVGSAGIETADGQINRRAIGYIYGFVDGALRTIGQDMGDVSIGVPIVFQVLL